MSTLSPSLRIGVLRGGQSPEYDTSLQSGANILRHLSETHKPLDIFISREGKWHMHGLERVPERILKNVDVVFNALHHNNGEVQEILNRHNLPHTGSNKYSQSFSMNKWFAKEQAVLLKIKTPVSVLVRKNDSVHEKAKDIFNRIPHPLIIKSTIGKQSSEFYKADSFGGLLESLENILSKCDSVIVEEYISGKKVSCLVLNNFRGQNTYSFPPTETLRKEEKQILENYAKKMHEIFSLKDYSSSDFVVSPRRGVYFLEVNSSPELSNQSLATKSLESVGLSMKDFLHHVISLAFNK